MSPKSSAPVRSALTALAKTAGVTVPPYADLPDDQLVPPAGTPDRAFLDRAGDFPIHTKAAAFWTAVRANQPDSLPGLRDVANRAADRWEVSPDVRTFCEGVTEGRKLAGRADRWAIEEGAVRELPIGRAGELEKSARALVEHRDELPFAKRAAAAGRMLDREAELGVTLTDRPELEKLACRGLASPSAIRQAFLARTGWAPLDTHEVLLKYAAGAAAFAAQPAEQRKVAADLLDRLDRTLGVPPAVYGPNFPRAEDAFFGLTKAAAGVAVADLVETKTGSVYSRDQLSRLPVSDLAEVLGPEWEHAKSATVAESLLRTASPATSRTFDTIVKTAGIRPAFTRRRDFRYTPGELGAFAGALTFSE